MKTRFKGFNIHKGEYRISLYNYNGYYSYSLYYNKTRVVSNRINGGISKDEALKLFDRLLPQSLISPPLPDLKG